MEHEGKRQISINEIAMAQERDPVAAVIVPSEAKSVWRSVALFYVIACGMSWLIWLPLILGPKGLKIIPYNLSFPVIVSLGTLGPLVACFIAYRQHIGS